jgi:hypothetical protein
VVVFPMVTLLALEPGSSVSIVSGYGLDDQAIEVRSPAEARDFFCNLCDQSGSGAHPASCTMSTGGPLPGAKARHPLLVPRSRMSRSYTSSPPLSLHRCVLWDCFTIFTLLVSLMIYTMVIQLSSSLGLNIVFALSLRENKSLIVLSFKASSQIFVLLTVLILKLNFSYYMPKYKCYLNVHK